MGTASRYEVKQGLIKYGSLVKIVLLRLLCFNIPTTKNIQKSV